jgi:MoxR-like ATPase
MEPMNPEIHRYRGDGRAPEGSGRGTFPYLADDALTRTVNIAMHLGKPLLVKGPPGCGKTTVAASIAHELGLPLHSWYIKSTSRAVDGLYTIDVVRRLQDAQHGDPRAQRITPYLRFGELGRALRDPGESVVLIDEIDKADIDFPNDLLRELDRREFTIEELDETQLTPEERQAGWRRTYSGVARPIVVITSNDEKELPDAFLRRCIFHWIDFPGPQRLLEIVRVNTRGMDIHETLIREAIARLEQLRAIEGVRKKPATSELIDWVRVLAGWGVSPAELDARRPLTELPHWKVLFKHQDDEARVKRAEQAAAS